MKTELYSFRSGLKVIPPQNVGQILKKINNSNFAFHLNCADKLRKLILGIVHDYGWSNESKIGLESNISITSRKGKTALCLQTGNVSRFYADLLKLQVLYKKNKIKGAIYILPLKETAKLMGSNLANYSRFIQELGMFKEIITIPMVIIGIGKGEKG